MSLTDNIRQLNFLPFLVFIFSLLLFANHPAQASEALINSPSAENVTLTAEEKAFILGHPEIRIGIGEDWAPFVIRRPSGELEGFEVDLLNYVNSVTGANIKLVAGPWKTAVEQAKTRGLDGLALSAQSKSRAEFFHFTDSYIAGYPVVITGAKDTQPIASLKDLNGKALAILAGNGAHWDILAKHPEIIVVEKLTEAEVVSAVIEGTVAAALIGSTSFDIYSKRFPHSISLARVLTDHPLRVRYSIRKDWPELVSIINKGLASLPAEKFNNSYYHWFGIEPSHSDTQNNLKFSTAENKWLAQNHVVHVNVSEYAPLQFFKDKPAGISIEYLNAIAQKAGFKIRYKKETSWPNTLNQIQERKGVDILLGVMVTEERKKYLAFSEPYLSFPFVIFTHKDSQFISSLDDLRGKKVSVGNKLAVHDFLKTEYPDIRLLPQKSIKSAIDTLIKAEADAFVGSLAIGSYYIRANGLEQVKVAAPTGFKPQKLSIAVRSDWPELASIINKTLASITPAEHEHFRNQWLAPIHYDHGIKPRAVLIWVSAGAVIFIILGSVVIITTRANKKLSIVQKRLSASENKYKTVINKQRDILLLDKVVSGGFSTFIQVNDAAVNFYGYSHDELLQLSLKDLIAPERLAEHLKAGDQEELFKQGNLLRESIHITRTGEKVPVEISATLIEIDSEEYILTMVHDLRQRKDDERQIRRFNHIVKRSNNEIYIIDQKTLRFLEVNNGACQNSGYSEEELMSKTVLDINPLMEEQEFSKIVAPLINKTKDHIVFRSEHQRKDGSRYPVEAYLQLIPESPPVYLAIIQDITKRVAADQQRVELEHQLHQKYKMETVGFMAGGMAHNFNNNLSIILGNIELSQMKQSPDSEVIPLLENAKTAVRRSRDLVQKIITYSRKGVMVKVPMHLTTIIDETVDLLNSTMPTTVVLQKHFGSGCDTRLINADPSQIQEVLINLCNNAVQAMDEQGVLKITLEKVELEDKNILAQYDSLPGQYAKLSVQDTGSGIPADMIDKIFDPFYSTKEEYEGAGMGLSTVQGIVAQHGGMIKVNSVLNQGTTFELYFPLLVGTDLEEEPAEERRAFQRGDEHILFVDDDERLASLGEQLLNTLGYQVSTMTDSTEALKMFTANADRFDLVMTDQTMPGLTGKDLIAEMKKVRGDIPTILCTGYSSKIDEAEAAKLGISVFMMKPLDLPQLSQTIRQVLGGAKK